MKVVEELMEEIPYVKVRPKIIAKVIYRARQFRYVRFELLNSIKDVHRPFKSIKPVIISTSDIEGYRFTYANSYFIYPSEKITWSATYENITMTPVIAKYEQEILGVKDEGKLVFRREEEITKKLNSPEITKPTIVTCRASVTPKYRMGDSITKTYSIGIIDYKLKPISEYPVEGALNKEYETTWMDVWNFTRGVRYYSYDEKRYYRYPPKYVDVRIGVSLGKMATWYEGVYYRVEAVDPYVRIRVLIGNQLREGYVVVQSMPGLIFTTYEDPYHVSIVKADSTPSSKSVIKLAPGKHVQYEWYMPLPSWIYGKVAFRVGFGMGKIVENKVKNRYSCILDEYIKIGFLRFP